VAHTIEIDNEAEHRLPHRTTREDDAEARSTGPWLVSFSLWANVLQYLDADGMTVADLRARARTGELLLAGLRRWGYVTISAPAGEDLRTPPQDGATVRPRKAALRSGTTWAEVPGVVDERWRQRLGAPAVDRLRRALRTVFDRLPVEPPAYLPVVHPTQGGKIDAPLPHAAVPEAAGSAASRSPAVESISPLLSGVLFSFAVDVEATARIALPISANTLRVLTRSPTRVAELPRLTGVSREANAMCVGWLERRGCVVVDADTSARRGKVISLTAKGKKAQDNAHDQVRAVEESWQRTYDAATVGELRAALHEVVGDGTLDSSPLAAGLEPYPDNWRAAVRRPDTLPHYPMVLHRGGYPDGS
jgi:DNA-binding MarR family transcriptional regulator